MIKINKHIDILKSSYFTLFHDELTSKERNVLSKVNFTEFVVKSSRSSTFKGLMRETLLKLLIEHKIYFVYCQIKPYPKSKVRSFKKMFYEEKKSIGLNNLFELEIDTTQNESIFASIVKVNKKNFQFCIDELEKSNLVFIFTTLKRKRSFTTNRSLFLKELLPTKKDNLIRPNILKFFGKNINKNKSFIRLNYTGNNEEVLEFFTIDSSSLLEVNAIASNLRVTTEN